MSAPKFLITLLGSSALLAASGLSAVAQTVPTTSTTPSQQAIQETQDSRSLYSVGNSNLNVMQLIHNANLLNGRSSEQFNSDQSESFNDAVKNFRSQQRKLGVSNPSASTPESKPVQK
jgi:hypothetical protein